MLLAPTEVRPSAIHGLGLFALREIPKDTEIARFEPGFDLYYDRAGWAKLTENVVDAVHEYTFGQIYRLYHIPTRYYCGDYGPDILRRLCQELYEKGRIDLDRKGQPCCLSGQPSPMDQFQPKEEPHDREQRT
jgi:hypothetical protein